MEISVLHERSLSTTRSERFPRSFARCRDEGLTEAEVYHLQSEHGKNVLPVKSETTIWQRICICFILNAVSILLCISAIISAIFGYYPDMAIMFGIQFINSYIAFRELIRTARIHQPRILPQRATCRRDGQWLDIDTSDLVPGDLVLLTAGSKVPADCCLNHGKLEVNQSLVTGHSAPLKLSEGDVCRMGSNIVGGEVQATVQSTGNETFYGQTQLLNQNKPGRSLQVLIFRVMAISILSTILLCGIILGELIALSQNLEDARASNINMAGYSVRSRNEIVGSALTFTVALVVASVPIALEALLAIVLGSGARILEAEGALVKDTFALDEIAGMDMLCCDKTGTMTTNKMEIQQEFSAHEIGTQNQSRDDLLLMAALACNWTQEPSNEIDSMILDPEVQDISRCDSYLQHDFIPFSPALKYSEGLIEVLLSEERGQRFRVRKGEPETLIQFAKDRAAIESAFYKILKEYSSRGIRCLAIAKHDNAWKNDEWVDEGNWQILGILAFLDPLRSDTRQTIIESRKYGIEFKMLTGDNLLIATEIARRAQLGIDPMNPKIFPAKDLQDNDIIPQFNNQTQTDLPMRYGSAGGKYGDTIIPADGFAQLLPEQKAVIVATLQQAHYCCAMLGDGINDLPAIKQANVGIAMSNACCETQTAAQILLVKSGISAITLLVAKSREVYSRLKSIVIFRIASTMQLLVFSFIALLALRPADYYTSNFCPKNIASDLCWASSAPFMSGRMSAQGEKMFAQSITSESGVQIDSTQRANDYVFYLPTPRTCAKPPLSSYCDLVDPSSTSYADCILRSLDGTRCPYRPRLTNTIAGVYIAKGYVPVNNVAIPPFNGCTLATGCTLNPLYLLEDPKNSGRFKYPSQFLGSTTSNASICLTDFGGECLEAILPWPDFFQLPPLMLLIITLLLDATLLAMGFDNVIGSIVPQRWNLLQIYLVSTVLGAVSCGSSLIWLWAGLDSNNPDGLFAGFGIPPMEYGKVVTMTFLKVSVSELLTLISARGQEESFWSVKPGKAPCAAVIGALVIVTILAILWPSSALEGIPVMGLILPGPATFPSYTWMALWTWLYCLVCFFIQDALKVGAFKIASLISVLQVKLPANEAARHKIPSELEKDLKMQLSKEQQMWSSRTRRSYPSTPMATWRLAT